MSSSSGNIAFGAQLTFSYHSCDEIENRSNEKFKKYLILTNILNAASIVLSPLAGLVRIIATCVMFFFNRKNDADDAKASKNFLVVELVRGGLELLCLGPILGIVDAVVTLHRYEMLCFKQA